MFSPIHSTYECILCNDPEFLIFIDLKILHVHIIAMGHLVFLLTLTPETWHLKKGLRSPGLSIDKDQRYPTALDYTQSVGKRYTPWQSVPPVLGFKCVYPRSGFKTSNQVQSQGGARDSSAGIYLIFRVLNPSVQHRNWALGEILKPLLIKFYVLVDMSGIYI
jgi:hypothetical protein